MKLGAKPGAWCVNARQPFHEEGRIRTPRPMNDFFEMVAGGNVELPPACHTILYIAGNDSFKSRGRKRTRWREPLNRAGIRKDHLDTSR